MSGIKKALRLFRTQSAMAAACGGKTRQPHVHKWVQKGEVPAQHVLTIVRALHGRVTPYELRPDLYPDPLWLPPGVKIDDVEAA